MIPLHLLPRVCPLCQHATITGHGRASKDQMQHAMLRELGLATVPEPADVADALAAALCHYYAIKLVAGNSE